MTGSRKYDMYIYTMEYYLALRKKKKLPFVTTWEPRRRYAK